MVIQQNSGNPWEELCTVFRMGDLLQFCTDELSAQDISRVSKTFKRMVRPLTVSKPPHLGKKHLTMNSECGAKYLA